MSLNEVNGMPKIEEIFVHGMAATPSSKTRGVGTGNLVDFRVFVAKRRIENQRSIQ